MSQLSQGEDGTLEPRSSDAAPPQGICPHCGKEHPETVERCIITWEPLVAQCPLCGKSRIITYRRCRNCGCYADKVKTIQEEMARSRSLAESYDYEGALSVLESAVPLVDEALDKVEPPFSALLDRERMLLWKEELLERIEQLRTLRLSMKRLTEAEEFEQLEEALNRLIALAPGDIEAVGLRKRIPHLIREREEKRALSRAAELLDAREYDRVLKFVGENHPLLGELPAARRFLEDAREKLEEVAGYRSASERLVREGDYRGALECCGRLLELLPPGEDMRRRVKGLETAAELSAAAQAAFDVDSFDEAAEGYEKILQIFPGDENAARRMLRVHEVRKEREKAAFIARIRTLMGDRRYEEVLSAADSASFGGPGADELSGMLAEARDALELSGLLLEAARKCRFGGDMPGALEKCGESLDLYPHSPGAGEFHESLMAGISKAASDNLEQNRFEEARAHLELLLRAAPRDETILARLEDVEAKEQAWQAERRRQEKLAEASRLMDEKRFAAAIAAAKESAPFPFYLHDPQVQQIMDTAREKMESAKSLCRESLECLREGKVGEAQGKCRASLDLDPFAPFPGELLARLEVVESLRRKAEADEESGAMDEAAEEYEKLAAMEECRTWAGVLLASARGKLEVCRPTEPAEEPPFAGPDVASPEEAPPLTRPGAGARPVEETHDSPLASEGGLAPFASDESASSDALRRAVESGAPRRLIALFACCLILLLVIVVQGDLAPRERRARADASPSWAEALAAKEWLGQGLLLLDQKKSAEALACLDQATKLDPNLTEAWRGKGDIHNSEGRHEEAKNCYSRVLKKAPRDYRALNGLGFACYELEDFEAALEYFMGATASAAEKDRAAAFYNMGLAYFSLAQYLKAHACFEVALQLDPTLAGARAARMRARRECDSLRRRELEALRDAREEREALRRSELATSLNEKGERLVGRGAFSKAITCFEKAASICPDQEIDWTETGFELFDRMSYGGAMQFFRRAIKKDPQDARAWNQISCIFNRHGRNSEALPYLEKAISVDPGEPLYWRNMGVCLHALGQYERALQCYDRAIALKPADAEYFSLKGSVLQDMGNFPEAVTCYEEAIRLDHGNADYWERMGRLQRATGMNDQAEECLAMAQRLRKRR